MFHPKRALQIAAISLIAGCTTDGGSPIAPPEETYAALAADAYQSVDGFYFLPPMAREPVFAGTFDPALTPTVEVCVLSGPVCGAVIATFTSGTGSSSVRLGTEHYIVNWNTAKSLDPTPHYRITVRQGDFVLGSADVDVVSSGGQLRGVNTGQYVGLVAGQTLPIKFRVETGIAGSVEVSPDSASIAPGETQQFTAVVHDLHGAAIPGATVTWSSSETTVATIDANGLATGVGAGSTTITATSGDASGTAVLVVEVPNTAPSASPDTFQGIGNVTIPVGAPGVLGNDTDAESSPTVVPGTVATTGGGTVTLAADGSFTYLSAPGFTGDDAFDYTITDGSLTATATVTLNVPTRVWYARNDAAAPGDGRDASPFALLSAAEAASAAGETVFLLAGDGTAAGNDGFDFKAGQSLIGQGVPADVTVSLNDTTVVLLAAGGTPQILRTAAGAAIQLASGNTLRGVDVASTAGAGIAGSGFGTFTASQVDVAATGGPAASLQNGTASAVFGGLSSTASTGDGLTLSGLSGAFSADSGSIAAAAGIGVSITGGAGTIAYGGEVSGSGTRAVSVTGRTGGAVGLSGSIYDAVGGILVSGNGGGSIAFTGADKVLATGSADGVTLLNNTGASIVFGGGGLVVTTTGGTGFAASGGGTVTVTGAGNTVASGAAQAAVSVQGTTIGAAGMTFRTVSAAGAVNGILLAGTGAGGFQVTGDGASDPGSATRGRTTAKAGGGTLTLGSGGTVGGSTDDGVSLNGTGAVVLRNMVITAGGADGVEATGAAGLVIDNTEVSSHNDARGVYASDLSGLRVIHAEIRSNATTAAAALAGRYNLQLNEVTGLDSIHASRLQHSQAYLLWAKNTLGSLDLRVTRSTLSGAGIGAAVLPEGTASVTASFDADSIAVNGQRGIQAATAVGTPASLSLSVTASHFNANFVAVDVVHAAAGTYGFTIDGNTFVGGPGTAQPINVNRPTVAAFSSYGPLTGTVSGNTIGTAGLPNSGSDFGDGITVRTSGSGGTARVSIRNNTIREVGQHGISIAARDAPLGHTLEARVDGNTVGNLEATGLDAINILPGALSTDGNIVVCVNVLNNSAAGIRNGLRLRPSGLPNPVATVRLHGWDGVANKDAYFLGRNVALTGGLGATSISATPNYVTGSCTTP